MRSSRCAITRVRRVVGLISALSLLAAACAPSSRPASPPTPILARAPTPAASTAPNAAPVSQRGAGDTLRLFYWQAPTMVNPHLSAGTKDLSASRIAYEPLASYDSQGQLVPFLAAEIPSLENGGVARDGRSVTWKLKPGVKWSDGQPFTAADVLFTYEYITNPKVGSTSLPVYDTVTSVEVIDDTTVRVNFKDVNPAWSLPFVGSQGAIIPRHIFASYNGANANDAPANLVPVGTGPYRGVEYRKEDVLIIGTDVVNTIKIIYEPNPFFREADKPFFKRVELQGGGGDAVFAARAIQAGQIDFAWNLMTGENELQQLDAGGKARAIIVLGSFTERIMINFADHRQQTADGERANVQFPNPFFKDRRVRQAMAHAVDRDAVGKLYGRTGRATHNLLVSPPIYVSGRPDPYPFDLKKAAALLDEAGWSQKGSDGIRVKDGQRFSILFQTSINPVRQGTQKIVRDALQSIGVEVELKNIDSSVFLGPPTGTTNTRRQFYADFEEFAFNNKSPDAGAYMKGWTCSEIAQKANNWSLSNWARYCNPAYDALYKLSTTEMDFEKRRQLFVQMNDLLIEDVALISLVQTALPSGVSTTLDGVALTPWDEDVWKIKDWRRK